MRTVRAVVLVVALGILFAASCVGVVLFLPHPDPLTALLGSSALTTIWVTTLVVGSVAFWFDTRATAEARRVLRRARIVSAGLALAGCAVLVWLVVARGLAWWFAVIVIVVALLLQVLAVPLARRLGGPAREHDAGRAWAAPRLDSLRRGRRRAVIIGLASAAVVAAALVILSLVVLREPIRASDAASIVLLSADLGLLATGIVVIVPTFGMSAQIRSLFGGDLARGRRIAKRVLRGKGDLEPGDERAAARYAQVIPAHQENLFGGIICIELGVFLSLVNSTLTTATTGFLWFFLVAFAVFIIAVVVGLSRLPRARRYAREHAAEARGEPPADGAIRAGSPGSPAG